MAATHEDWLTAVHNRDSAARLTARALNAGNTRMAETYAAVFAKYDEDIVRISAELDTTEK